MKRISTLSLLTLLLVPASAFGEMLTYRLSGYVFQDSLQAPFGPWTGGTPFTGTLSIDVDAPRNPGSTLPEYDIPHESANFTIHAAGLTLQSTAGANVLVGNFVRLNFHNVLLSADTFTPTFRLHYVSVDIQVPEALQPLELSQWTSLDFTQPKSFLFWATPGNYVFPDSTYHQGLSSQKYTGFSANWALVPEPSSIAIGAMGLITLAAIAMRRPKRAAAGLTARR